MPLDERRKLRLAFVVDLDQPELRSDDVSHFRRVLRMEPGAALNVSDGQGAWRRVRLGPAGSSLTIDGETQSEVCPSQTTVAFAPTKGDRPEWTIQKLTEIGVSRIAALRTQRSVVKWDSNRAERQVEKWRKVAREAAMQSRRVFLPAIEPQTPIERFVSEEPAAVLCEPGGRRLKPGIDSCVVIGPEGGFSQSELDLASHVDLGTGTILKTETATVVAAGFLVAGA